MTIDLFTEVALLRRLLRTARCLHGRRLNATCAVACCPGNEARRVLGTEVVAVVKAVG